MRLYQAVDRLAMQAGEDTNEAIDWLCGEHGGMFKLYEAYFSPKKPNGTCPTCESLSRAVMADHVFHDKLTKPLTDEQLIAAYESEQRGRYGDHIRSLRAIEAAHGIKGE